MLFESKWITYKTGEYKSADDKYGNPLPYFRKTFSVKKGVKKATLFASALGVFKIYLNGAEVSNDYLSPGWVNYSKKLIPVIVELSGIDPRQKVNSITRDDRHRFVELLKNFTFTIKGKRPVAEAIITSGGINVKEINSSTMESKLCKGFFFAGEVIDVDAYTGGFNLQIAFSTGYLAGSNA